MMKKGTRVKIIDGRKGEVIDVFGVKSVVMLDTGEVVTVLNDTLTIISLIKSIWAIISKLWK